MDRTHGCGCDRTSYRRYMPAAVHVVGTRGCQCRYIGIADADVIIFLHETLPDVVVMNREA